MNVSLIHAIMKQHAGMYHNSSCTKIVYPSFNKNHFHLKNSLMEVYNIILKDENRISEGCHKCQMKDLKFTRVPLGH